MIAGYSQEPILASTDPSMTNLIEEPTRSVTPFETLPSNQRGSLMRLSGMPEAAVPQQGIENLKAKSGHRSGYCKYCQAFFERLSLHKCKLAPEVDIQHYITVIICPVHHI